MTSLILRSLVLVCTLGVSAGSALAQSSSTGRPAGDDANAANANRPKPAVVQRAENSRPAQATKRGAKRAGSAVKRAGKRTASAIRNTGENIERKLPPAPARAPERTSAPDSR